MARWTRALLSICILVLLAAPAPMLAASTLTLEAIPTPGNQTGLRFQTNFNAIKSWTNAVDADGDDNADLTFGELKAGTASNLAFVVGAASTLSATGGGVIRATALDAGAIDSVNDFATGLCTDGFVISWVAGAPTCVASGGLASDVSLSPPVEGQDNVQDFAAAVSTSLDGKVDAADSAKVDSGTGNPPALCEDFPICLWLKVDVNGDLVSVSGAVQNEAFSVIGSGVFVQSGTKVHTGDFTGPFAFGGGESTTENTVGTTWMSVNGVTADAFKTRARTGTPGNYHYVVANDWVSPDGVKTCAQIRALAGFGASDLAIVDRDTTATDLWTICQGDTEKAPVLPGGTVNQVVTKISGTEQDAGWKDPDVREMLVGVGYVVTANRVVAVVDKTPGSPVRAPVGHADSNYPDYPAVGWALEGGAAGSAIDVLVRGVLTPYNTSGISGAATGSRLCSGVDGVIEVCDATNNLMIGRVIVLGASGSIYVEPNLDEEGGVFSAAVCSPVPANRSFMPGDICIDDTAPDAGAVFSCPGPSKCFAAGTLTRLSPVAARLPRNVGRKMLWVGDSITVGWGFDEPWSQYYGGGIMHGFRGRFASAQGAMSGGSYASTYWSIGEVGAVTVPTSGSLFGAGSETSNLIALIDNDPTVSDVVLMLGANDFTTGSACAHSSIPNSNPSGACTKAQSMANLQYVLGELNTRGINAFPVLSPGILGVSESGASDGTQATLFIQEFMTDLNRTTGYCSGKTCYPIPDLYLLACAGSDTAPDPAGTSGCAATNSVNHGSGLENQYNPDLFYFEDAVYKARLATAYRWVHPSGWGYQAGFRALMRGMIVADSTLSTRWIAYGVDWQARPGRPLVTVGTPTATTIPITSVARGPNVNGDSGGDAKCGQGDCVYYCWASVVEVNSPDPSGSQGAEPDVARAIGTANGAVHYAGENPYARAVIGPLRNGDGGTLRGLYTGTDYKVVCVAVTPTDVSNPYIEAVSTP